MRSQLKGNIYSLELIELLILLHSRGKESKIALNLIIYLFVSDLGAL